MKKKSLPLLAKEKFLDLCAKGVFTPGQKIPSESEMAKKFGISRETWRSTLEILRREGILYSKHGSGTYLIDSTHKITNDLSELRSLSEMIKNAGIVEHSPKLTLSYEHPSAEVAQMLLISEEDSVCVLKRTRYSDAGAICSSVNYIPASLTDELDIKKPLPSIFGYFEQVKGIVITRSATRIIVPTPNDPIAEELRKSKGVSILGLKQQHFDSRGNPCMYSIDYLRCDMFDFFVTRIRQR